MATKATKGARRAGVAQRVPLRLREAQKEAAKLLQTMQERVNDMLPPASRKRLAQLETRFGRVRKEVERVRTQALRQAETRARRAFDEVGQRATAAVRPVVALLDLASKADVERLRKRIGDLERRIDGGSHSASAA